MISGQLFAVLSAALFGVSPVLCKMIIGDMAPALLAGLLYLGSGVGLQVFLLLKGQSSIHELSTLSPMHRRKLAGAIVTGGVVAPLCLAYGIKFGTASEVSLLLNLETVATTVIAWLCFKEYVGMRVWGGKLLILAAAAMIILNTEGHLRFSMSGLFVVLACIFWGIDNNLTRDVEELSSSVLAGIKGLAAGVFNVSIAFAFSSGTATPLQITQSLVIGALCYGLSLVLFVESLRRIGSARTSTFFAAGPFFGMLLSVMLLGERPSLISWGAAFLMLLGMVFLYREVHGHFHSHEALAHSHLHSHDEHHQHEHPTDVVAEPHDHFHVHQPITHTHSHLPDIHHRHRH